MKEFEKELAQLLRKHHIAIVVRDLKEENSMSVEVGFQKNLFNNSWTGRHHVTAYDLDGINTSKINFYEDEKFKFSHCGIGYDNAYDLGYKVAKQNKLSETGGNPYDPECVDWDLFLEGYTKGRNL